MKNSYGTVYLIPTSLSGAPLTEVYSNNNLELIRTISTFVVETPKIGRSFLKGLHASKQVSELRFFELNRNNDDIREIVEHIKGGNSVGVMSDAGYPGIGDMGSKLVLKAHEFGITVKSLYGPSSILQTLSSSGLNGQSFTFNGYLPKESTRRTNAIKSLEKISKAEGYSQIFIETPYRAQYIFEDIIHTCSPSTMLSLGIDIDKRTEMFKTMTVGSWRKEKIDLSKRQVVYILQA